MKKLLKSALFFAATGSALSLQALPVGNPAEPSLLIDGAMWEGVVGDPCDPCATWCDAVSFRLGFYGDYVFDRVLKVDAAKAITDMAKSPFLGGLVTANELKKAVERDNPAYGQQVQDAEMYTNGAYLALNLWDRFDVFCTLGAMNSYFKVNSSAFELVGLLGVEGGDLKDLRPNIVLRDGIIELYCDTTFSWSVGARGALWECGAATLGAEFQYAQSSPKVRRLNTICNAAQFSIQNPRGYKHKQFPLPLEAGQVDAVDTHAATIKYHEWQTGLSLSYRLNMLVPYVGLKWSRAAFDADNIRIAQPKLKTAVLNLTALNPTFLGEAVALPQAPNKFADFFQIVSLQLNKMKSRKSCGVVVGATLIDADKWAVTGEARLVDERAAHVNAQFRF